MGRDVPVLLPDYANIPAERDPRQRASTLALRSELRSTGYLLDPDSDIAAYEMDADMSVTGLQPGDIVFYNATTTETVAVADEPQIEDLSPDADTELLQALERPGQRPSRRPKSALSRMRPLASFRTWIRTQTR